MSKQVKSNLRRSSRFRFTPVFLAEEQSQQVTFASLQSPSSAALSSLSFIGSETRCTSSPNRELSNFHREKKRIRPASPTKQSSSNIPLKVNNAFLIASKFQEKSDSKPCSPLPLPGDKIVQKPKPHILHSCPSDCACHAFVHGKYSISTKKEEESKSSLHSLILRPINATPCYNLKSKKGRLSCSSEVHPGANGNTTSDPQMIPKRSLSHPAPEKFIEGPISKARKKRVIFSQFQIVHDEIPYITRLRQIGLYFGSNLEENAQWADVYLYKTGVSRQNHVSFEKGTDDGSREQRRGTRERYHKLGTHCGRYRATMNFDGVCLNLGSGHLTSAEAAAALDLGQCLLKGSENQQTPAVLSRPELISGLQAAGLPKSHGDRADPLRSFKVNEVTKVWFESMVENALTSLGGMDYQLSHILAGISNERV